jgi:hypothetical protein
MDGHVLSLLVAVLSPVGGHTHTLRAIGTRGGDGPTVFWMTNFNTLPKLRVFQFVIVVEKVDVKSTIVTKDFFNAEVAPMIG